MCKCYVHGAIIQVLENAYQSKQANKRFSVKYFSPFNTFPSPGVDYRKDFLAQGATLLLKQLLKASRENVLKSKTPEFPCITVLW